MTMRNTLDRRSFVSQALALSTTASLAGLVHSGHVDRMRVPAMLALYRETDDASLAFAGELAGAGVTTLALQEDVVRQWRDGLELELLVNNKLLLGLSDWDDFAIITGLAAEHRRRPLLSMQHSLSGRRPGWEARHAGEILALTRRENAQALEQALATLAARNARAGASPSRFSWLLG